MQRGAVVCVFIVVRRCVWAFFVVAGCSAGAGAGSRSAVAEPPVIATKAARASALPAGLYFRNGYVHCEGCATPRWAAIAGVFADASAAAKATAAVRSRASSSAGYPFVVHTDELAITDQARKGIVVVAGLFEHEADASAFAGDDLDVVELLDFDAAFEIESRSNDERGWGSQSFVVQLDGSGPIEAFDGEDLRVLEETLASQPWNSRDDYLARRKALVDALRVACTLAPDRLFVATDDWFMRADLLGATYEWQPAVCDDGKRVFVRHSDTRRHAIVLPGPDGPVIEQIVDVTCDVATRQRWAWRDDHRDHADTELDPIASRC